VLAGDLVHNSTNIDACPRLFNRIQVSVMDPSAKRFTTSTLVAAAGCEIGTFHKWRSRNGLFPETIGAQGWNKFSIIDICIVRIIVVLTAHRLSADLAVDVAQRFGRSHMSAQFGPDADKNIRFVGLYAGDPNSDIDAAFVPLRVDDTILTAMQKGAGAVWGSSRNHPFDPLSGVLTTIDLLWVAIHVIQRIKLLEPDLLPEPFDEIVPTHRVSKFSTAPSLSKGRDTMALPKPKPRRPKVRK
jgi:hypothetical protein